MTRPMVHGTYRMRRGKCNRATCARTQGGLRPVGLWCSPTWSGWGCDEYRRPRFDHPDAGDLHAGDWRAAAVAHPTPRPRYPGLLSHHFSADLRGVAAPGGARAPVAGRILVRDRQAVDLDAEHSLPHGSGRHLDVAGATDHVPDTVVRAD